jgi:predicted GH43/DUF377 family glycosyl hydrolase
MFAWEKLGRIFDPRTFPDRPEWMAEYALAPWTVLRDDVLRVYFGCRPPRDASGQRVTYTAYVDLDRTDLFCIRAVAERPVLSLGARGCFDEFGTYPLSVIEHEGELRGYYAGWTRCVSVPFDVAIGAAVSRDGGRSFERLGPGPILPFSPDEPFTMSGPKVRRFGDTWYMFYIAGREWLRIDGRTEISHRIRLATSADGLTWTKHGQDLIPPMWDGDEAQASPDVVFANGRYHMFFCGWVPRNFRQTRHRTIGYAWSTDLHHWERDDSRAGIAPSADGWDSEMVAYPHVFTLDGNTYMLYIGNEVGRHGFGLARLTGSL